MNFDQATDRVLRIEGGYVNNPNDPGKETNWGITWPPLNETIGMGLLPAGTTIRDLTRDEAKVVYKALFWDRGHMDEYDGALAPSLPEREDPPAAAVDAPDPEGFIPAMSDDRRMVLVRQGVAVILSISETQAVADIIFQNFEAA